VIDIDLGSTASLSRTTRLVAAARRPVKLRIAEVQGLFEAALG
jgi:hypothetical protein